VRSCQLANRVQQTYGSIRQGQTRILPRFQGEVTLACYHAGGKYRIRKIAFINLTRKDTTLSGGCFRVQFDIPFGPGVPRTDRQYTGSHSLHHFNVLLSPANDRAAGQAFPSRTRRSLPSTQAAYK